MPSVEDERTGKCPEHDGVNDLVGTGEHGKFLVAERLWKQGQIEYRDRDSHRGLIVRHYAQKFFQLIAFLNA